MTSLLQAPLYAATALKARSVLVSGGGGSSKTGVRNRIALCTVKETGALAVQSICNMRDQDDVAMCLTALSGDVAVLGVNKISSDGTVAMEIRRLSTEHGILEIQESYELDIAQTSDDFLKFASFSHSSQTLLVASACGSIWLWHNLVSHQKIEAADLHIALQDKDAELVDVDLNEDATVLLATCRAQIAVYDKSAAAGPNLGAKPALCIKRPAALLHIKRDFKFARFGHGRQKGIVYTVFNDSMSKGIRGQRATAAWLTIWESERWSVKVTTKLSSHPASAMDVASNGQSLGFAFADLSVQVRQAATGILVARFSPMHSFAITTLLFLPENDCLVTTGVDGCAVSSNFQSRLNASAFDVWPYAIALLLLSVAIFVARMF